jgi:hypothetical protein
VFEAAHFNFRAVSNRGVSRRGASRRSVSCVAWLCATRAAAGCNATLERRSGTAIASTAPGSNLRRTLSYTAFDRPNAR